MRWTASLVLTALAFAASPAAADDDAPVAVEMFLSQSCKLSPPAAEYMRELHARPDLVVLSWHVDYWDMLSNRKAGRWKDPFGMPASGVRQRIYNRKIRDRGTVFTPQAIINGAGSAVGSKRSDVESLIDRAHVVQERSEISFAAAPQGLQISIRTPNDVREAYLVTFRDFASTHVKGGDNAGLHFREANVVTGMIRLGTVGPRREAFVAPAPQPGTGCAVLLQERGQGAVTAARYCPDTN